MEGGAWWAIVCGVAKIWTQLSDFHSLTQHNSELHDNWHFQMVNIPHCAQLCWRRQWHPTPVLLPGKSHGWRSLVGCSPWGREESDRTERLHFHFSLSCIGEGNGNPLQCSCLENPRDGGARWAAVCGVSQSDLAAAAAQLRLTLCDPVTVACQDPLPVGFFGQEYWTE